MGKLIDAPWRDVTQASQLLLSRRPPPLLVTAAAVARVFDSAGTANQEMAP